jgi:molybdopterin synthase sulfurtransferase
MFTQSSVVSRADALVVEVGWGPPASSAHIPGAVYLDTDRLEREADSWKLAPGEELIHLFEMTGISIDTKVVVYGASPLAAARAMFAMVYAGVADVRMLDGGFRGYLASGRRVAVGEHKAASPRAFGAKRPRHPTMIATRADVESMIGDPAAILADVRSLAEFEGRTSGYPYIEGRGRIPGARWAKGGPHANRVEEYTDDDGFFFSTERVRAMWAEQGIDPSKRITFYCGTSWRASIAFLYARACRFPNISVYDGGWMEWSARPRGMRCDKREA